MKDLNLLHDDTHIDTQVPIKRGPPNRMNDLVYRDWMKFQKSFFWYTSSQALVEECIYFFTKAVWPEGSPSQSLILGVSDFNENTIPAPRKIDIYSKPKSLADINKYLEKLMKSGKKYDFIFVDLRDQIKDTASLDNFLNKYSDTMFQAIQHLLVPLRYCGIIIDQKEKGAHGFPIAWSVALSARDHLRLRDEKIGLIKEQDRLLYCLFMQAEQDTHAASKLKSDTIDVVSYASHIPGWTIPKPPPRLKSEILHPAKYPETLIEQFINIFSKPGDNILDPMVGTGSTVIAALRTHRNGYGIDLSQTFVDIAKNRIKNETSPLLFSDGKENLKTLVVQGDSTKISGIKELSGVKFNYAVTSPPYWSMLTNPGSENQELRRKKNLQLIYSEDKRDLGNIEDYETFLVLLDSVYTQVAKKLTDKGVLTVVVKNIKRQHILYTLAWDLVVRLCGKNGKYNYIGNTLWCQDDISIKPFAVGIHWVSNILHHYCLHFQKK